MRIGSMDAAGTTSTTSVRAVNTENLTIPTKENKSDLEHILSEGKNISSLTQIEKNVLPVSDKLLLDAIEKANKAIAGANRKLDYSVHEATNEIMVKVIDTDTNKVVREFPPEKILDMVAKMLEMAGLIVDERR